MASLQFAGTGTSAGGGAPEGRFGSAEAGGKAAEAALRTACPSGAPAARKFSENTGLLRLQAQQTAGGFTALLLLCAVNAAAADGLSKIHLVSVKFRPIHAGKTHLPAHGETAAAAHPGAIDHDGIHADGAGGIPAGGQVTNGLHHGQGADGENHVEALALLQKAFQRPGDKALLPGGAVIAAEEKTVAGGGHFLRQDDLLGAAEPGDGGDPAAPAVQGSGSGQGDGAAQSAADDSGILEACDVAGAAQRAGEGGQGITGPEGIQQQGGAAHHLVDDGDGSGLGVKIRDGEGDALAVFGGAEDDELAGGGMGGHFRGREDHAADAGGQGFLAEDGCFHGEIASFRG